MNQSCTLVIASYNSGSMLRKTLECNITLPFDKIIIVDGLSEDNTKGIIEEIGALYPGKVELLGVPKRGLANARNIGSRASTTKYIMHAGPDNIFTQNTLDSMFKDLERYDLVSCQTRFLELNDYLDIAHDIYKKRFSPGIKDVVGTPYLAKKDLFDQYPFDEDMLNSDDTELCHRLRNRGKSIYRSESICHEIGFLDLKNILERWPRWGRGDVLYYNKRKADWSYSRRIKSYLRPFIAEIIEPFENLTLREYLFIMPFLFFVCSLRYYGWLRYILSGK